MRLSFIAATLAIAIQSNSINAFTVSPTGLTRSVGVSQLSSTVVFESAMAESGVPPSETAASAVEDSVIPSKLPSDVGMDYVPLATMLATGQILEADQVRLSKYLQCFEFLIVSVWSA